MGLDAKYRPRRYGDVLGQEATVAMLRGYVTHGRGFSQSYVFAGAYGSGKTTLARILARALLCRAPIQGQPCDTCPSCIAMLEGKDQDTFVEVDAATHSGKAQVEEILQTLTFDAFAGRHRIFLWDECLTGDALLMTPQGLRSIQDLVESKYEGLVLSFDSYTHKECWRSVTGWFAIPDEREVLTLTFDTGAQVTLTPDHPVFTRNRGWVAAAALEETDDICEAFLANIQEYR